MDRLENPPVSGSSPAPGNIIPDGASCKINQPLDIRHHITIGERPVDVLPPIIEERPITVAVAEPIATNSPLNASVFGRAPAMDDIQRPAKRHRSNIILPQVDILEDMSSRQNQPTESLGNPNSQPMFSKRPSEIVKDYLLSGIIQPSSKRRCLMIDNHLVVIIPQNAEASEEKSTGQDDMQHLGIPIPFSFAQSKANEHPLNASVSGQSLLAENIRNPNNHSYGSLPLLSPYPLGTLPSIPIGVVQPMVSERSSIGRSAAEIALTNNPWGDHNPPPGNGPVDILPSNIHFPEEGSSIQPNMHNMPAQVPFTLASFPNASVSGPSSADNRRFGTGLVEVLPPNADNPNPVILVENHKKRSAFLKCHTTNDVDINIRKCKDFILKVEDMAIDTILLRNCNEVSLTFTKARILRLVNCKDCIVTCHGKVTELFCLSCEHNNIHLSANSFDSTIYTSQSIGQYLTVPFQNRSQIYQIKDYLKTNIVPNAGIITSFSERNHPQDLQSPQDLQTRRQKLIIENLINEDKSITLNATENDDVYIRNCVNCAIIIQDSETHLIILEHCDRVTITFRSASQVRVSQCKHCKVNCYRKVNDVVFSWCRDSKIFFSEVVSFFASVYTLKCSKTVLGYSNELGIFREYTLFDDYLRTTILPDIGIITKFP